MALRRKAGCLTASKETSLSHEWRLRLRTGHRFVDQLSGESMRKVLTTIAIIFCLILAAGLFLQTDSNFSFEYKVNGEPLDGPLGALGSAAGMVLALVAAGFGLLVAVFVAFGVSLLLAGLFVGVGVMFLFAGFPFAAPLVVVAAVVWVIARRPRENGAAQV